MEERVERVPEVQTEVTVRARSIFERRAGKGREEKLAGDANGDVVDGEEGEEGVVAARDQEGDHDRDRVGAGEAKKKRHSSVC